MNHDAATQLPFHIGIAMEDAKNRLKDNWYRFSSVKAWTQWWGSTSCGYGGIAGASCTLSTIVVISKGNFSFVYIAGRLAYRFEERNNKFEEDCSKFSIQGQFRVTQNYDNAIIETEDKKE